MGCSGPSSGNAVRIGHGRDAARTDGSFSPYSLRMLNRLIHEGMRFTIASARGCATPERKAQVSKTMEEFRRRYRASFMPWHPTTRSPLRAGFTVRRATA